MQSGKQHLWHCNMILLQMETHNNLGDNNYVFTRIHVTQPPPNQLLHYKKLCESKMDGVAKTSHFTVAANVWI
jgi:hypothetical protein